MIEFSSEEVLFERVYPILILKRKELDTLGYQIKEIDIWSYLRKEVFPNIKGLTLYDVSYEIMHLDISKLSHKN